MIELAVVLGIMGMLAAIAIPTFLGQRAGAQDRQAHSTLRNTLAVARAASIDMEAYVPPDTDPDDWDDVFTQILTDAEPAFTFLPGESSSSLHSEVSVSVAAPDDALLAVRSASGICWLVRIHLLDPPAFGALEDAIECAAADFDGTDTPASSFGSALD